MATIKVFSSKGVKELNCFDTLENVAILDPETYFEADPFDAIAGMESDRPINYQFTEEGQKTMAQPPPWLS